MCTLHLGFSKSHNYAVINRSKSQIESDWRGKQVNDIAAAELQNGRLIKTFFTFGMTQWQFYGGRGAEALSDIFGERKPNLCCEVYVMEKKLSKEKLGNLPEAA